MTPSYPHDGADGGQCALAWVAEQYVEAYNSMCLLPSLNLVNTNCNAPDLYQRLEELLHCLNLLMQEDGMDAVSARNGNRIHNSVCSLMQVSEWEYTQEYPNPDNIVASGL